MGDSDRKSCGTCYDHPGEQGGCIRRDAQKKPGNTPRIDSGLLVDDEQPRVDRRAVLRIGRAVDGGGEHELGALLQAKRRRRVQAGLSGAKLDSGDRDETPAFGTAALVQK